MRLLVLPILLPLLSCSDDKDSASCAVTLTPVSPTSGQADVYYRAPLTVSLSAPDSTTSLSLTDAAGAAVPGTLLVGSDGLSVSFVPSSALSPSTSYTLDAAWCGGTSAVPFTTSSLGSPLTADITGNTYAVDPNTGRFLEPADAGALLGGALGGKVLLGIVSQAATLTMLGSLSEATSDRQDTCNRTTDIPAVDFSEAPYFELSKQDVSLVIAGSTVKIGGMSMSGTFTADGSAFEQGMIAGELDARSVAPALAAQFGDLDADGMCELLGTVGVPCGACVADGENYCVNLLVDQITANATGEALTVITDADCDASCALSCDNAACVEAPNFEICE